MSNGEINEVIEALVKGTSGLSSHSDEEKKAGLTIRTCRLKV